MRVGSVVTHGLSVAAALVLGGCFDDIHLGAHACDACRECEACVEIVNGVATCRPTPSVGAHCGDDGNVHLVDSCGASEDILTLYINGACQEDEKIGRAHV